MVYRAQRTDAMTETAAPSPAVLAGLTVLEVAEGIAGPACGLQLADLGAAVIKIEPPDGDRAREWGPPMTGDVAAIFAHLNRGKQSLALDLAAAPGRALLERLLGIADVVLVHMDPPERAAAGIDWATVSRDHPRLVVCEILDHGSEGPFAGRAGSELTAQALAGFTRYIGEPGGPPLRVGYEIASMGAAMGAVQAVMAALIARDRGGEGQLVRLPILGHLLSLKTILLAAQGEPDRWEGFHLNGPTWPADTGWPTKDGQVTFDFRHQQRDDWVRFCQRIGLGYLPDHPDYKDWRSTISIGDRRHAYGGPYREVFAGMTSREVSDATNGEGGISVKFHDYAEVLAHEQVRRLDPLVEVPTAPTGARRQVGMPFELCGLPVRRHFEPAPALDQHRGEILAALGGA